MLDFLVPLGLIALAAVLLAIANHYFPGPPPTPERNNLAEAANSIPGPDEAVVVPLDRRGRRP